MQSNVSYAAAIGANTPVPATSGVYIVLPSPLANPLTASATASRGDLAGWNVPAGASGVFRLPSGATGGPTWIAGGPVSDGFVVCGPGTPVPPIDPRMDGATGFDKDRQWPWSFNPQPGKTLAAFLKSQRGSLGSTPFLSGQIAILGALSGSLTVGSQVIPAGASGCIALSAPIGPNTPWVFSNNSDWNAHDVFVVGALA